MSIVLFVLLNILRDFKLGWILNKTLKASPSSTIEFLITFSSVIKFPKILILSTNTLSKSSKLMIISILFYLDFSFKIAFKNKIIP